MAASEYKNGLQVIIDPGPLNCGLWQVSREKQGTFNQEVILKRAPSMLWFGSTGENLYLNRQVLVDYG